MSLTIKRETPQYTRRVSRLTITGIIVTLAAMWCSIGYFIIESRAARIEEEQRVLARMTHVVQEQTHSLFSLLDYFLVSADIFFTDRPAADPRTDPVFASMVKTFRSKTGGLIDIRFVSEGGGLFYLGNKDTEPLTDVSDRDYYQAQMTQGGRGLFIGKPVRSRVTQRWGLPISYPLRARPHGIAVIYAAIENRALAQPFDEARTKPNGTILLAHRDGTILFRSPDDDPKHRVGTSLASASQWAELTAQRNEGVFKAEQGVLDDKTRIGAFASIPDYPLVVIASSPADDILVSWRTRSLGLLFFGSVATIVALGVLLRLAASMHALIATRLQLERQALTDDLTQLPNRRHYIEQCRLELARAKRYQHPVSILYFDIDHFKTVNDTYGHQAGDLVLQSIAAAVLKVLRAGDLPGRLGGEEFAVLLPETSLHEALKAGERLRQAVAETRTTLPGGQEIQVTISIGVAMLGETRETLDQFLMRADKALYAAKNSGRNQIATPPGEEPPASSSPS